MKAMNDSRCRWLEVFQIVLGCAILVLTLLTIVAQSYMLGARHEMQTHELYVKSVLAAHRNPAVEIEIERSQPR